MAEAPATRKRRRPALSCEQCRRRKIKCDRAKPCEHCRLSRLDCTYHPQENIHMAEYMTTVFSLHKTPSVAVDHLSSHQTTPKEKQQDSVHEQLKVQGCTKYTAPPPAPPQASDDPGANNLSCVPRGELKGVFSKNRYFGQSHWMTSVSTLRLTTKLFLQQESNTNSEIHNLTRKCKAVSRKIKAQDKIISNIAEHPSDYVPRREVADKLVHSYLQNFESIYRIIHIPCFQQEYDAYWTNPRMSTQGMVTKLLLIMAIGGVFQPLLCASAIRSSALQWINIAQTWVSTPFDKYRLTIEGLQIQCLLIFARLVHDVDGDLLRLSAGSLLQTAMQIGLHIDAEVHLFQNLSAQDIQLRRKLWTTVLEIVVQTSVDSGGVPLIRATDYDSQPPLNIDDDTEVKRGSTEFTSSIKPGDKFTQSSLQIMLSKSLPLRLEITAFVNDFRLDSTTYEKAMSLSENLLNFCASNSTLFQYFKDSAHSPTDFQIYMIELLTHQYLFALHFPYAIKAKSNHSYYYSRKVCLDTARLFLPYASQTTDEAYTHLRLWGGGLFRAIPLQAAGFIAEELLFQIETETVSFSKDKGVLDRRNELRRYIEEYTESAITRIRHRHTNVRPYVIMSGLLSHIDALTNGYEVEETILTTIKNSLATCYEVLCGQLNEPPPSIESFDNDMQDEMAANGVVFSQGDFIAQDGLLTADQLANLDWWLLSGDIDNIS